MNATELNEVVLLSVRLHDSDTSITRSKGKSSCTTHCFEPPCWRRHSALSATLPAPKGPWFTCSNGSSTTSPTRRDRARAQGFGGVQITPPAEHKQGSQVWWTVYQPVSFKNFNSFGGSEAELRSMIARCNAAGVKGLCRRRLQPAGIGFRGTATGGGSYNRGNTNIPSSATNDLHQRRHHHQLRRQQITSGTAPLRHAGPQYRLILRPGSDHTQHEDPCLAGGLHRCGAHVCRPM